MSGRCHALKPPFRGTRVLPQHPCSFNKWHPAYIDAKALRRPPALQVLHAASLAAVRASMKAKRRELLAAMRVMPDYSMNLSWRLGSAVPGLGLLLRRYAPADTYTLWKVSGACRGLRRRGGGVHWRSVLVHGSDVSDASLKLMAAQSRPPHRCLSAVPCCCASHRSPVATACAPVSGR
jgi:hypothetical protein